MPKAIGEKRYWGGFRYVLKQNFGGFCLKERFKFPPNISPLHECKSPLPPKNAFRFVYRAYTV